MNWSEVDDATLRKNFKDDGLSYRDISDKYVGATVGKVAGRCRRLGLRRDGKAVVIKQKPNTSGRKEPDKPGTLQLVDLDSRACRYPFGDPRKPDFGFCGITQTEGSPYCADHAALTRTKSHKEAKQ